MSLQKLELQNIEGFELHKKKDESAALIAIFGEVCELRFLRDTYTFRRQITAIDEMDADIITRLNQCFSVLNGGLPAIHSRLILDDDIVYSVMDIDLDEISNVKIHDRIIDFFGVNQYLSAVFTSHSI